MEKDDLGNRMKDNYEKRGRKYLTRRVPVILRLDGKAFHTYTKDFERPFSKPLSDLMTDTAKFLCENIQGAKLAYTQSDEITILITDFDKLTSDAWFNYESSKMNSIAASMAGSYFNKRYLTYYMNEFLGPYVEMQTYKESLDELASVISKQKLAFFDCRAFNIPEAEIVNCFRWRYQDWLRNSIQMLAQSHFSHKELHGKNKGNMHDMLMLEKGVNWNDLDPLWKNGTLLYKAQEGKWKKDSDIKWVQEPMFLEFVDSLIHPDNYLEEKIEELKRREDVRKSD